MKIEEWYKKAERGTSGDMVYAILEDWKKDLKSAMEYNEWRKQKYVEEFIDNLDELEHPLVMFSRVMKFCYEEGQKN